MPRSFSSGLQGGTELKAKLTALPKKISGKIARQALRDGAKFVQKDEQAEAPKRTRFLSRRIKVRAAKRKRGRIGVMVTVGARYFTGKKFYGAAVDLGHRTRPGKHQRRVVPDPFVERTVNREISSGRATQIVGQKLWEGIEREAVT